MKNPKLSFILPCYNIERFIERCIETICQQGLADNEYEIICVNDCSPDHTRDIILKLQSKHKNLILIDHEKNKRVGAARNTGFYAAKGEYIWFIDPDDVLYKDAAAELLPILDKENLDFVQFGHDWMEEDETPIPNPPFNHNYVYDTDIISGIEFLREYQKHNLTYSNMHVGCYVRIYRRSYLEKEHIIFPEVAYYEDQYQALHGLIAAKRMRNIARNFYSYRVVSTSYSHVEMSIAKRASQVLMCTGMLKLMQQYQVPSDLIPMVWARYIEDLYYFGTHFILFMSNDKRSEFIHLIKSDLVLLGAYIPRINKFMCYFPKTYLVGARLISPIAKFVRKILKHK